jgi:hypothetical protein
LNWMPDQCCERETPLLYIRVCFCGSFVALRALLVGEFLEFFLLRYHRLHQIAGMVHVISFVDCDVIREQL